MISLDTETTGIDLHHGALPFLVTTCDDDDNVSFWEWDVDPLTRKPIIPRSDWEEILDLLMRAVKAGRVAKTKAIIGQNLKFDVQAMNAVFPDLFLADNWPWDVTADTLFAGHLLASNQPHDLTSMALVYLGTNIQPYEDKVERAVKEALGIVKKQFPNWAIAISPDKKKGRLAREDTPSAKDKVWKFDMWLPRALIKIACLSANWFLIPDDARQPTVGRVSKCTVRIDRQTKWGNPFIIGKDGDRAEVIRKYAAWIWSGGGRHLLADLPELYNQVLGCHCSPEACHGDILRTLCHPWMTVTADYANMDSAVTLPLYKVMRQRIDLRGYGKVFDVRLELPRITTMMEQSGITLNENRLTTLYDEYKVVTDECRKVCLEIAGPTMTEMPEGGTSNALKEVVFTNLGLVSNKLTKKAKNISMDKDVIAHWLLTEDPDSVGYKFVKHLSDYRKRKTAMNFMESYRKFWKPIETCSWCGLNHIGGPEHCEAAECWYRLHPSLNPTGTDTLRWSSNNPNEQNISKKEGFNLRYMFGPAPGREWWSCDAQNIELRIPAYEAGERAMIDLFERPDDPPYFGSNHMLACHILHPEKFNDCIKRGLSFKKEYPTLYGYTKNGNFAVQYGAQAISGTADRAYHVTGAQAKIEKRLGRIRELNARLIAHAEEFGYVETIPDINVDPDHGYPLLCTRTKWGKILATVPLSYHVQGTAMWWMMVSQINCQAKLDEWNKELSHNFQVQWEIAGKSKFDLQKHMHEHLTRMGYRMTMQVHDEIVFDFPYVPDKGNLPKVRELTKIMAKSGERIGIPIPAGIEYHEHNWSEGETCV